MTTSKQNASVKGIELIFSPEDQDLNGLRWRKAGGKKWYGQITREGENIYAHRIVVSRMLGRSLCAGEIVDHINHDGYDNRRENLRLTDKFGNRQHLKPSPFRGTYFQKKTGKWVAQARHRGRAYYLGSFESREDAAEAAAQKRKELNFLGSEEVQS